jgi:hypothetical protein
MCTPRRCELKSGRRIAMKKLLFAISAATLLVAGPAAFAGGPQQEAEGDYAGWRAATRAGIVGFPEDRAKNGLAIRVPNNVGR